MCLSFWGGGGIVLPCGSDAVTHITRPTRFFWTSSFFCVSLLFLVLLSLPRMRCAGHGVGQGVQRGLPPRPEAVNEHPRDQRSLEAGVRRGRSPVHAAVHGRGGRGRRRAVHGAEQTRVVEVRRREHSLQGRVVPRLGQQLQADRRLPLPLRPGIRSEYSG